MSHGRFGLPGFGVIKDKRCGMPYLKEIFVSWHIRFQKAIYSSELKLLKETQNIQVFFGLKIKSTQYNKKRSYQGKCFLNVF